MKIGFFEIAEWEKNYISAKLLGHNLFFEDKSSGKEVPADIEILSNFVGFPVTEQLLEKFSNLKYITTRSTGFDHIDLKACALKNILVSNVPTYGENTVAEFAFSLMLALSRKVYPAVKQVKEQGLFGTEGLQGFDLKGKKLGVVGTGHIGTYVIKIAKGFDMEVVAYDPFPKNELATQFGFTYVTLEELLKTSDIVTLHVPYMPATHHIINSQNITLLKPSSILINTARGGLVETSALVDALKLGKIAGAGLDVLEEEGFIKEELEMFSKGHPNEQQLKIALADHELMYMENVLVTPHNAFNSHEALQRILDTTINNIAGFSKGQPVNIVKLT